MKPVTTDIIRITPQIHMRTGDISAFALSPTVDDTTYTYTTVSYIQAALEAYKTWDKQGIAVPLWISLTSDEVVNHDIIKMLTTFHEQTPHLPITIQLRLVNNRQIINFSSQLAALTKQNITICLDHFGDLHCGYDALRQIPITSFTLSPQLTQHVNCNTQDFVLVSSAISLAQTLNKRCIMINIHDVQVTKLLLQMGAEYLQGSEVCAPMMLTELLNWYPCWQPPLAWSAPDANPWPEEHQHLLKATVAHRQWLKRLEDQINTQTYTTPENINNTQAHLTCELGCWMSNQGMKAYGQLAAFHQVDILHQAFHAEADRLLFCATHTPTDTEMAQLWHAIKQSSQTLTEALLNLKNTLYTN